MFAGERGQRWGGRRLPGVWFWGAVALLAALLVFVVPLWFPPKVPAFYSSYTVGFNNRLATLSAMGVSLLVAALLYLGRCMLPLRAHAEQERLGVRWLGAACLVAGVYTAFFGWLMVRSGSSSADVDYIMIPLQEVAYTHGRLYRDAEFAYGPLLFDLARGMQWLLTRAAGARPVVGYLAADLFSQWAGACVLFFVVQRLPMRRAWKAVAIVVLTLASLRPALGLNYTMLRFGTPYALLLLVTGVRAGWRRVGAVALAQAAALAMSPEMGVAFGVGVVVFAGWEAWEDRRKALLIPALLAGAGGFAALVDRNYFYVFAHFASGMLNMVVTPLPHILLLLTAALGLAPLAAAAWGRLPGERGATGAAFFAIALVLLSPALGLCDELHTLFNGVGMFLLALVAASELAGVGVLWGAALLLLAAGSPAMDSAAVARAEWGQHAGTAPAIQAMEDTLDRLPGRGRVYAPAGAPQAVRDLLMAEGRWVPSYFSGLNNAVDRTADERKVGEMQAAAYVLVPEVVTRPGLDNRRRMRWLRFGYAYRDRRNGYEPLTAVRAVLRQDFVLTAHFAEPGQRWDLFSRRAVGAKP